MPTEVLFGMQGGDKGVRYLHDICPLVSDCLGVSIRAIGGNELALRVHKVEVASRDIIADGRRSIFEALLALYLGGV